jgi:NADH-quinone oxidoreductase subunit N
MALRQTNIRRMLGYSSIAQAGNILIGMAAVSVTTDGATQAGASGVLFFLATYAFTNLGAFFAIIAISNKTGSDDIADYAGMGSRAPIPAFVLLVCLLSLTGLPPTAGFFAKLYVFNAAIRADLVWLVVIGAVNTAISAFYYLGVVREMYFTDGEGQPEVRIPLHARGITALAAAGVLTFSVYPIALIEAAQRAVNVFV